MAKKKTTKKKAVKRKAVKEPKKTAKKKTKAKKTKKVVKPIKAVLLGENVVSNAKTAMDLYSKSRFGEIVESKIQYSLSEALYLAERKRMEVYFKKKKLSFDSLMEKAREIDERVHTKFIVFRDMRKKGYIIKTALKFGAEFRVYDKGIKPGQDHAKWILYPVHESSGLTWHEFAAKNRVAHSTRKNLLIAIVDEEGDCTFYEISWIRP